MTCTFKPMQAYGCSRASLLQRIGVGDIWKFLQDLVQNTMLRADFYDGEGNFYHGMANTIGGEGTVSLWSGGTEGSGETVNDYWQGNPQSEEFLMAPGATSFVRSSNRYHITTEGGNWLSNGTMKEMVHKVSINGETWYGRIPLWSEAHNEGHGTPYALQNMGVTPASFAQVGDALEDIQKAFKSMYNTMSAQGILRVIEDNVGGDPG